jgi:hypothetical protein
VADQRIWREAGCRDRTGVARTLEAGDAGSDDAASDALVAHAYPDGLR